MNERGEEREKLKKRRGEVVAFQFLSCALLFSLLISSEIISLMNFFFTPLFRLFEIFHFTLQLHSNFSVIFSFISLHSVAYFTFYHFLLPLQQTNTLRVTSHLLTCKQSVVYTSHEQMLSSMTTFRNNGWQLNFFLCKYLIIIFLSNKSILC